MDIQVILGMVILGALIGVGIYSFVKLDKAQKIVNVKEWLKWAVVEAEKALGGGTGQLKLRWVYDLAIKDIMANPRYSEMVSEVSDYINKIYSNDKVTMEDAYELVKGEYPIEIPRRSIYNLIISNMKKNTKKGGKQKSLARNSKLFTLHFIKTKYL